MKYRIKTGEELEKMGYIRTPNGNYVHPSGGYPTLSEDGIEHAKKFSEPLIKMIREGDVTYIDGHAYIASHFTEVT